MKIEKKFIEYYFYHYHELCASHMKAYGISAQFNIPRKKSPQSYKTPIAKLDLFTLRMLKIVEQTYKTFEGKKREVMKLKYFNTQSRLDICTRLDISPRTYHRYLAEILKFANCLMLLAEPCEKANPQDMESQFANLQAANIDYFTFLNAEI